MARTATTKSVSMRVFLATVAALLIVIAVLGYMTLALALAPKPELPKPEPSLRFTTPKGINITDVRIYITAAGDLWIDVKLRAPRNQSVSVEFDVDGFKVIHPTVSLTAGSDVTVRFQYPGYNSYPKDHIWISVKELT